MAQAPNNLSRRSLIASAAIVPALALPSLPALAGQDPIFAAIKAHRTACSAWSAVVTEIDDLEVIIPSERRQNYHITHRGTDVGKDDDPRWIAVQERYWARGGDKDKAALAICDTEPTTRAGIVALLAYATEHSSVNHWWMWPDQLVDGDSPDDLFTWPFFVMRNVAQALSSMGA